MKEFIGPQKIRILHEEKKSHSHFETDTLKTPKFWLKTIESYLS